MAPRQTLNNAKTVRNKKLLKKIYTRTMVRNTITTFVEFLLKVGYTTKTNNGVKQIFLTENDGEYKIKKKKKILYQYYETVHGVKIKDKFDVKIQSPNIPAPHIVRPAYTPRVTSTKHPVINDLKTFLFFTGFYHLIEEVDYDKDLFEEAYTLKGIGKIVIVKLNNPPNERWDWVITNNITKNHKQYFYKNSDHYYLNKFSEVEINNKKGFYYYYNISHVGQFYENYKYVCLLVDNYYHVSQVKNRGIKLYVKNTYYQNI